MKYLIPVAYEMYGRVEVEADTPEEALKWAEDNIDILELPEDASYVEASFEIDYEGFIIDENGKFL